MHAGGEVTLAQKMFISNANQVITMAGHSDTPAKKEKMSKISIMKHGSIWIEDGRIVEVGRMKSSVKNTEHK